LLGSRTRPSRTLRLVLERLLPGIDVKIDMFVARRVRLDETQRVKLGVQNTQLGQSLTIGRTVLDRSGAFRIVVGPVGYDLFEAFAPGGRHHNRLRQVVDQFSGGILESELELRLAETESPRFQLGSRRGGILGITTQLVTERKKPMRYRMTLSEDASKTKPEALPDDADEREPTEVG
jgi:type VI secretion system protein ImpH